MLQRLIGAGLLGSATFVAGTAGAAQADAVAGWHPYIGVSAVDASIRTRVQMLDIASFGLDKHPATWGVFAGVRPNRHFGIEVNYFDFAKVGTPPVFNTPPNNIYYKAEAKAWSLGAFAVGYLPLGKSPFELYGKAGAALVENRQQTLGDYSPSHTCVTFTSGTCTPVGVVATDTTKSHVDPAFGVGLQYRAAAFRVRLEYQRDYSLNLNPSMVSLGLGYSW